MGNFLKERISIEDQRKINLKLVSRLKKNNVA